MPLNRLARAWRVCGDAVQAAFCVSVLSGCDRYSAPAIGSTSQAPLSVVLNIDLDSLVTDLGSMVAAVSPDGELLLFDTRSSRGFVLDSAGVVQSTFGRRGRGPGEYERGTEVAISRTKLFVRDIARGGVVIRDRGSHGNEIVVAVPPYLSDERSLLQVGDSSFALRSVAASSGRLVDVLLRWSYGKAVDRTTVPHVLEVPNGSAVCSSRDGVIAAFTEPFLPRRNLVATRQGIRWYSSSNDGSWLVMLDGISGRRDSLFVGKQPLEATSRSKFLNRIQRYRARRGETRCAIPTLDYVAAFAGLDAPNDSDVVVARFVDSARSEVGLWRGRQNRFSTVVPVSVRELRAAGRWVALLGSNPDDGTRRALLLRVP